MKGFDRQHKVSMDSRTDQVILWLIPAYHDLSSSAKYGQLDISCKYSRIYNLLIQDSELVKYVKAQVVNLYERSAFFCLPELNLPELTKS